MWRWRERNRRVENRRVKNRRVENRRVEKSGRVEKFLGKLEM